eukprot:3067702-Karenia_brevis.AAC.1
MQAYSVNFLALEASMRESLGLDNNVSLGDLASTRALFLFENDHKDDMLETIYNWLKQLRDDFNEHV